ncbi:MAG: kynureninase [Wenzhouxiangellaceae bacterium]|nr:kynureninase [Wenzhouxiangellaceae bacterium]
MHAAQFRHRFSLPRDQQGNVKTYFCGNSLGLMPDSARSAVDRELDRWAQLGVEGHFDGDPAWLGFHRQLDDVLARLTGAAAGEVVAMGALTLNLHLLMASFFRPDKQRRKILIERGAFPSDRYAVVSQLEFHGLDPAEDLIELEPDADGLIDDQRIVEKIQDHADSLALVMWPGVQYATGQRFDMARICRAARANDVPIGLDLAHAIGNVPLKLSEWEADFAVWCSYKYLNAGPGAVAGLFVHHRHADFSGPRLAGWWGHDESRRMLMAPDFEPMRGAEGWQVSGAPILNLAALAGALSIYREADIDSLQDAQPDLTAGLIDAIESLPQKPLSLITPKEPGRRGCQISLRVEAGRDSGRALFEKLQASGVVGDWREPDIIRIAPNPLYNSTEDAERFMQLLSRALA